MKFVDNIDWLQVSFSSDVNNFVTPAGYSYRPRPMGTKMFRNAYDIVDNNLREVVAELLTTPNERMFEKNFKMLRLKNRYIYTKDYRRIFADMQRHFGFGENYSLCRVDLCRDFQKFKNGLQPETFIRRIQNQEYILKGKRRPPQKIVERHKYEKETKIITTTTIKENHEYKTTTYQKKYSGEVRPETLYISSGSNFISKKLYNKSQEMRDKGVKTHIQALHDSVFDEADGDVWRLEFSLKGSTVNAIERATGEVGKLRIDDLDNITELLNSLINQQFVFWKNADLKNRSRDWETVQLFDPSEVGAAPYEFRRIDYNSDSGRAEKIFLKKLAVINLEQRTWDKVEELFGREETSKFLSAVIQGRVAEYGLEKYFREKVLPHRRAYVKNERGR